MIERTWFTQTPDGREFELVFRVAAPVREPGGEWSAEAGLFPIESGCKIYGEDGWQAASLALRFLAARAQDFSERGWKFFWNKGGEEATVDELMV